MGADAFHLIVLSAANAFISFIIADSPLLAPLRLRAAAWHPLLGKLLSCGLCAGTWTAVPLVALHGPLPPGFIVSVLATAWLSGWQWAGMRWLVGKIES